MCSQAGDRTKHNHYSEEQSEITIPWAGVHSANQRPALETLTNQRPGPVSRVLGLSLQLMGHHSDAAIRQTHNNQARKQWHCQAQATHSVLWQVKQTKTTTKTSSLDIGYLCWKRVNGICHLEIFKSFLVEDSGIMLQEELIWQFASKGWRFWGFESS